MEYPSFFDSVPAIELHDPLAELLGATEKGLVAYRYVDAVKLAGHSCPVVAGAWLLTKHSLATLYPTGIPQRGNILVETRDEYTSGTTGVTANVIGLVTGAAGHGGVHGLVGRFF